MSSQVGFLSSVPYIGRFAFAQMSSAAGDLMVARPQLISKINVRRFWYTIAFLGPAAGLAALSYATNSIYSVILIMTLGKVMCHITHKEIDIGNFMPPFSDVFDYPI